MGQATASVSAVSTAPVAPDNLAGHHAQVSSGICLRVRGIHTQGDGFVQPPLSLCPLTSLRTDFVERTFDATSSAPVLCAISDQQMATFRRQADRRLTPPVFLECTLLAFVLEGF